MGDLLHVGIWDFKIYLLKSGSITRGQGATGAQDEPPLLPLLPLLPLPLPHPQSDLRFPHESQFFLHPHIAFCIPHLLQDRVPENPSSLDDPPTRTRSPSIS
jgi:hypothetical protein